MDGLLTCRQCSKHMENLKDHTFWDFYRPCVRKCFSIILVTVIVLTLWIIYCTWAPPEIGRNCPKDQAKGLHNISQLEAEKVALGKQLTKMEKGLQKLRKFMNQTQEKTLQLLEKKQKEVDALIKESMGFNQSLVLTRQFLEKEKEKTQSLQSQLMIVQEDLRKIQQQRDSWQKQLKTLEEQLKPTNNETKEYKEEIKQLKQQLFKLQQTKEQQQEMHHHRIMELQDQIRRQQKKCSIENILDYGTITAWALGIFGIFLLFICCVTCCRQACITIQETLR